MASYSFSQSREDNLLYLFINNSDTTRDYDNVWLAASTVPTAPSSFSQSREDNLLYLFVDNIDTTGDYVNFWLANSTISTPPSSFCQTGKEDLSYLFADNSSTTRDHVNIWLESQAPTVPKAPPSFGQTGEDRLLYLFIDNSNTTWDGDDSDLSNQASMVPTTPSSFGQTREDNLAYLFGDKNNTTRDNNNFGLASQAHTTPTTPSLFGQTREDNLLYLFGNDGNVTSGNGSSQLASQAYTAPATPSSFAQTGENNLLHLFGNDDHVTRGNGNSRLANQAFTVPAIPPLFAQTREEDILHLFKDDLSFSQSVKVNIPYLFGKNGTMDDDNSQLSSRTSTVPTTPLSFAQMTREEDISHFIKGDLLYSQVVKGKQSYLFGNDGTGDDVDDISRPASQVSTTQDYANSWLAIQPSPVGMTPMSHNSPLASQASTVAMTPLSSSIPHLCRGNLEASSLQNLQVPSFLPLLPLPKDQHDDKPGEVNLQRTQDHTAHSHMAHEAHETHPPQNPQTPSFLPLLPLLRDQRNDEPRGINLQRTQEDTTHSHTPPETQRTHTPQRLARDSSPALPKRLPVNLIIARGTLLHLIPGVSLPGHQRPVIEIRWWASRLCKKKYGLSAKDDGQPHGYFKTIDRVKVSLNAPTDQPLDQLLRNRLSYTHKVIPFRCTTYVSGVKPQHWVKYAKLENARVAWDKLAVDFSGYHNVAVLRRDIHSILLQSCRGRVLKSGGALNALSDAEWTHDMTELGKPWLSLPLAGEAYNARVIGTQQMIWWSAQSSPQVPFTDEELQSVRQGRNGPNGEEQSPSTSLGSDALIEYLRLPKSRSASF